MLLLNYVHRPYWSQHHLVALTANVQTAYNHCVVGSWPLFGVGLHRAVVGLGAVGTEVEERKKSKNSNLSPLYDFTPIAVETFRAIGESAIDFFRQLGRRIETTAVTHSFAFLMQRLSIVIQRGNAVCVAGTAPSPSDLNMDI